MVRFSNRDVGFWRGIVVIMIAVAIGIGFLLFPIFATELCDPTGFCSETTIKNSLLELIVQEQSLLP